jgi:5S rRNA maturation endonuclease (ribonuclease M5)
MSCKPRAAPKSSPDAQAIRAALSCGRAGCPCGRAHGQLHCPGHDDQHPSLSVDVDATGRVLLHCHAGCPQERVIQELRARGLWPSGGSDRSATDQSNRPRPVAVYSYQDERGELLFQVIRYEPKAFRQRRPDGNGGWVWSLDGVRRVLYRLPEVIEAAKEGRDVWVAEGEKDAERLRSLGLVATTAPGGAGKWQHEYSEVLRGAKVRIVVDRDEAGRKHAAAVASALRGVAAEVRIFEPAEGKDISDHLDAGLGLQELVEVPFGDGAQNLLDRTAELVEACARTVRRFVVLSDEQALAVALWVLHTHALDAADVTPFLVITGPTMRSGKTRLLETLELLVAKPWRVTLPSEAVLFRKVDRDQPTLLLDECDAVFRSTSEKTEPLRALLNAGNRRGTRVPRCVQRGKAFDLVEFDVFCPRALAAIGDLPGTIMDRGIVIRLRRRTPDEPLERFRFREAEAELSPLRATMEAWGREAVGKLRAARPGVPEALDDRAAEAWEPLLAIADLSGGDWPARARAAAVLLSGGPAKGEDGVGVRLLQDIHRVFEEYGADRLETQALLEALCEDETAPWGDWHGRRLTPQALARLLRPFGIGPCKWREGARVVRGYARGAFEDAFFRYLPQKPPQPPQSRQDARFGDFLEPPQTPSCGGSKNGRNAYPEPLVADVAVSTQEKGEDEVPDVPPDPEAGPPPWEDSENCKGAEVLNETPADPGAGCCATGTCPGGSSTTHEGG